MCGIILWAVFLSILMGGLKMLWFWGCIIVGSMLYGFRKAYMDRKKDSY